MTDNADTPPRPSRRPVPQGYRQGIITAITIFLGFSLAFLRFWGFEAPGDWTAGSLIVSMALLAAVGLEIYALFRALRIADDDEHEYEKTVRWFIASTLVLLIGLVAASLLVALDPDLW
jgi:hypothetical protein